MPEQSFMGVGEMAVASGYAFEEHKIVTEDGYVLTAFRIPGRLMEAQNHSYPIDGRVRQPVQLQHGLFDQGGTWFFNEPYKSLAFMLVDDGYDVWITNSRGTANSN
jgi:hypothetical protein